MGYNGFPREVADAEHLLNNRKEKLERVVHAEVNAIISAGTFVKGCTLFVVPMMPCPRCATVIIQSDIERVIYEEKATQAQLDRWRDSCKISEMMFAESGVRLEKFVRK